MVRHEGRLHLDKTDYGTNSKQEGHVIPLSIIMSESAAYDNPGLQTEAPPSQTNDGMVTIDIRNEQDPYNESDPAKLQSLADDAVAAEPEQADEPDGCCTRAVVRARSTAAGLYARNKVLLWRVIKTILFLAYNAYLVVAILHAVTSGSGIHFCDGVGFLIIITALAYLGVLYYKVLVPCLGEWTYSKIYTPLDIMCGTLWSNRVVRLLAGTLTVGGIVTYLVMDSIGERSRLVSAFGVVVFLVLSLAFSHHPGKVVWRQVIWGMSLQLVFGLIILRWEVGKQIFACLGQKVTTFLAYTDEGSKFVFGFLVGGDDFVFAFSVLPVIIFFSFAIQILYYYGIMQRIIIKLGWLLQTTVGTTACESLNAAANIFVGQSEAPLLVKPYLSRLTRSELHAIMTGGFATIAGSVLAAYVKFGVSGSHLLSASVMSAPAALAISKLVYPETQQSRTTVDDITVDKGEEVNALDAASRGAMSVVKICGYIGASLIAFIAFIAFFNGVLGWLGELVGFQAVFGFALTFEYLASLVFRPVAWLMGVPWAECGYLGELIALKTILNEFVAYSRLHDMVLKGLLSDRAVIIATYALCGFSNLGAMGIQISGISAMAPERRSDLARLAFSAMMSGNVACFLTACIAGALISDPSSVNAAISTAAAGNVTLLPELAQNATLLPELAQNATLLPELAQNATLLATTVASLT